MLQKLEKSSEVVEFKISNKCFVALKLNLFSTKFTSLGYEKILTNFETTIPLRSLYICYK